MNEKIKNGIYWSIPILFLLGTLFHFMFNWLGKFFLFAPLFPVNESIWEHTKLVLIPLILFYVVFYFVYKNKYPINRDKWFLALLVSSISSILFMITFYYSYSGVIGKDITFVNILSLLLSLIVGQAIAMHIYIRGNSIPLVCSISSIIIIFVFYIIMSYAPIHIPLFFDKSKGIYSY